MHEAAIADHTEMEAAWKTIDCQVTRSPSLGNPIETVRELLLDQIPIAIRQPISRRVDRTEGVGANHDTDAIEADQWIPSLWTKWDTDQT